MSRSVVDTDEINSAAAKLDDIANRLDDERERVAGDLAPGKIAQDEVSSTTARTLNTVAVNLAGELSQGTDQLRTFAAALRSIAHEYTSADGFDASGLADRG